MSPVIGDRVRLIEDPLGPEGLALALRPSGGASCEILVLWGPGVGPRDELLWTEAEALFVLHGPVEASMSTLGTQCLEKAFLGELRRLHRERLFPQENAQLDHYRRAIVYRRCEPQPVREDGRVSLYGADWPDSLRIQRVPCVPGHSLAQKGLYDGSGDGVLSTVCGRVLSIDRLELVRLACGDWYWELDLGVLR